MAVGLIWVVLVPAEMLGVSSGLGYLILDCRDRLACGELTSVLFVPTAIHKPQGHTLMHLCILAFQHYRGY